MARQPPRRVGFKKVSGVNHFPRIHRAVSTGTSNPDKLMERYAATVVLIAKRSMKKAPKRPKSRFGQLKAYSRRSQKYGRYYWQKGMYSRPGQPPFWTEGKPPSKPGGRAIPGGQLRNLISYQRLGYAHFKMGPKVFSRRSGVSVPELHEHGGTVRTKYNSYLDRSGKRINRPKVGIARYPARPYMAPAMQKAKRYTRGGKHFIDQINNMAGLRANRRAS